MLEAVAWRIILVAMGYSPVGKGFARVMKRRIKIRTFVVQHWMRGGRSSSIEVELEPCEMVDRVVIILSSATRKSWFDIRYVSHIQHGSLPRH